MSDPNNSLHIIVSSPLSLCHEHSKRREAANQAKAKRKQEAKGGTYSEITSVGIESDMDLVDEIGWARDTEQGRS